MSRTFMRFPNFKPKALTVSYDDGVRQDKRLIEILQKYGLKGTFNLNSGLLGETFNGESTGRMTQQEILALYEPTGMEIGLHGYRHCSLGRIDRALATADVMEDRKALEIMLGHLVKGMAYANGSFNEDVIAILKNCGVKYARTIVSTENFELPNTWLQWNPTCHHNHPRFMDLAKRFVQWEPDEGYFWRYRPQIFYLWGHSYEFDDEDNWHSIENFAEFVGGKANIWYATNGEIYDYVRAYDRLEWGVNGDCVYNSSAIDVYINYYGKEYIIPMGKIINLK